MSNDFGLEVLVIDDDSAIGEEVCEALAVRNIGAHYAADVRQARAILESHPGISIAVVDYHMPLMSGGELIDSLKREFDRPFRFIMMTGDESQSVAIEAIRAQVFDFVPKPADARLLVGAIRRAAEQLAETGNAQGSDARAQVLTERIEVISGRLQQREALLQQLLVSEHAAGSCLSDEIRTSLGPLLEHLKQLKCALADSGSARDAAMAAQTMQQGLKLAEVIETLFETPNEAETTTLKAAPVDIAGTFKRILPALRRLATDRQVQIKMRIPATLPFLYADEGRLARALSDIAVGLISELGAGDHLAVMALAEGPSLITSFRISASEFDERLLTALTGELSHALEGLDSSKPAIPKFVSARIAVHLHGGVIRIDDPASPLRLIKLYFPLPEAGQAAVHPLRVTAA